MTTKPPPAGGGGSRCVFVGNIPYDATEHQLIEFFSRAGVVESFRMVFDRETRKPKGYGFCEFKNTQMALCAIRNLDSADFMGRVIRVDHADDDSTVKKFGGPRGSVMRTSQRRPAARSAKSTKKTSDEITRVVSTLTQPEKVEIMSQMKQLIEQDEKGAKDLLMDNPQLAQALLLIEFDFELVSPEDIKALAQLAVPDPHRPPGPQLKKRKTMASDMAARPPPPVHNMPPPRGGPAPHIARAAPMKQEPVVKNPIEVAQQLPEQQQNILKEVLKLTPDQILKLPPEVQHQVKNLQAQMAQQNQAGQLARPPPPYPGRQ